MRVWFRLRADCHTADLGSARSAGWPSQADIPAGVALVRVGYRVSGVSSQAGGRAVRVHQRTHVPGMGRAVPSVRGDRQGRQAGPVTRSGGPGLGGRPSAGLMCRRSPTGSRAVSAPGSRAVSTPAHGPSVPLAHGPSVPLAHGPSVPPGSRAVSSPGPRAVSAHGSRAVGSLGPLEAVPGPALRRGAAAGSRLRPPPARGPSSPDRAGGSGLFQLGPG